MATVSSADFTNLSIFTDFTDAKELDSFQLDEGIIRSLRCAAFEMRKNDSRDSFHTFASGNVLVVAELYRGKRSEDTVTVYLSVCKKHQRLHRSDVPLAELENLS